MKKPRKDDSDMICCFWVCWWLLHAWRWTWMCYWCNTYAYSTLHVTACWCCKKFNE